MERTVYVVNKSAHNFGQAEAFGRIVFLTDGTLKKTAINNMHRMLAEGLKDSQPDDYLLPCGLGNLNTVAAAIFGRKHGRLNLLLFSQGRYIERNIILDEKEEAAM